MPCGKCINCLARYSKEWAMRCIDELQVNGGVGCFVTLTYKETDGVLHRSDVQNFMKRLRKAIKPQKVRYFGSGEYGGKGDRPHYHIMLFGYRPSDLVEVCRYKGTVYYKSEFIENIWNQGFISVGDITFESAMYCAKYLQKLDEREHEVKPFTFMSLKPGIGVLNSGFDDIFREKKYYKGRTYPLPRYYVRRMEKDGVNVDILKIHRKNVAQSISEPLRTYQYYEDLHKEEERLFSKLFEKKA